MTKQLINWEEIHSQLSKELDNQKEILQEKIVEQAGDRGYYSLPGTMRMINEILVKKQFLRYINEMIQEVEYEPVE